MPPSDAALSAHFHLEGTSTQRPAREELPKAGIMRQAGPGLAGEEVCHLLSSSRASPRPIFWPPHVIVTVYVPGIMG